jgi:serine/alanine adding enzyme
MKKTPSTAEWDAFVDDHPRATLYHTWRWTQFAGDVFRFPVHRLVSYDAEGHISGVLPLILQRSRLFGRRLVSLPFFNYGGPVGRDTGAETSLLAQAADLAGREGVQVLEVRDQVERPSMATSLDKVTVDLELPASADALGKALGSKRRSQIRRCDRENPTVHFGGAELVPDFYSVFADTMRDLGTPVYPIRFFEAMLQTLAADCTVVIVKLAGRPAAAALLTHYRDRTEIPWAASLHALRETSVNMRLYWECLKFSIERGSRWFDFGRSTPGSGTYDFKLRWGGKVRQLYWVYPLESSRETQAGKGGARELAVGMWKKLPVPLATRLGSIISPGLPW